MKENKYRAWDNLCKEMILLDECDHYCKVFYAFVNFVGFNKTARPMGVSCGEPEQDRFVFMQYTGLKNKSGKEIDWWENDLLQSLGTDKRIGQIKYDEKCAEWRLYVGGNSWCSLAVAYYDGWKKVGSIHELPELMEKAK